jgi:hypothetical protein
MKLKQQRKKVTPIGDIKFPTLCIGFDCSWNLTIIIMIIIIIVISDELFND